MRRRLAGLARAVRKGACLALVLALPAHAQRMVDVQAARLTTDAGVEDVTGGVWLDDAELIRQAKEHAELRTQNEYLRAHAADAPKMWLIAALLCGVGIGFAAGFMLPRK